VDTEALLARIDDALGYTTEQMLAQRERLRLEDEAKRVRQQVLTLRAAP